MRIAHFPLKLSLGHQGRDGVNNQNFNGPGAHQRIGNFKGLLARVGLGNQEILDIHPKLLGIARVHRMLGINEGADAPALL